MSGRRYDVAQICLNGHLINDLVLARPELNKNFCDKCGAATITTCQKCNAEIPGERLPVSGFLRTRILVPAFCSNCGTSYPWTEKGLEAARELIRELEGLSEDEKAILAKDLDDIITDTPKTKVAAVRWKKALSKVGKETAHALRDILVDIASETAKKALWPQG